MSEFCGWHGVQSGPDELVQMATRLAPAQIGQSAMLAQSALALTGTSGHFFQQDGIALAVIGHPRLRLRDGATGAGADFGAAFAAAYRAQGSKAIEQVEGDFALALVDGARCLLALDRIGTHGLYYIARGERFWFATSADCLGRHPAIGSQIDAQALYNYVFFHMVPGPGTIYRDVRRVSPGEYVEFAAGRCQLRRYWRMQFVEDQREEFGTLKEAFLGGIEASVAELAGDGKVGSFLSGGTDSSTLAGMLGKVTGAPAHTYSMGFAEPGYDEMEFARIAARHFGTDHHEYYVTAQDIVTAIPLLGAAYDQPFGNSSAVPTYFCARLAHSDGVTRLLGGDGGDELFGGNERYAKQQVFGLYERVPGLLRKLGEPLLFGFPGGEHIAPVRKARSYVRQACVPMPARTETYNLLLHFGAPQVFSADFLGEVDTQQPFDLLQGVWDAAQGASLLNRQLALDIKFTLADNDLPKVTRTCAMAGVDVGFPLLSDRIVALSARLEPELKLKGTRLRYFFKEALKGFLPEATITKQKHGFGLPFGPWLQNHKPLRDLVGDSLHDLGKRGIVRADFLDTLTAQKVAEHPGYFGTMVWVLTMLEQWYKHHS